MNRAKIAASLLLLSSFFIFICADKAEAFGGPEDSRAVVKIFAYHEDENYYLTTSSYGSGVFIDEDGTIITNNHVVTVEDDNKNELPAAYKVCVVNDNSGIPDCSFAADLIAKDKSKDIAILKIRDLGIKGQTKFNYLKRNNLDNFAEGNLVEAAGFPGSGGDSITVTYGTITGKTEKYGIEWIKTGALVYFGSSGGALIDENSNLIGITTKIYSDVDATQGFAISIASINDWIEANKGSALQVSPLQKRLDNLVIKNSGLGNVTTFSNFPPNVEITKESGWEFGLASENVLFVASNNNEDSGYIIIYWKPTDTLFDPMLDVSVKANEIGGKCYSAGNFTAGEKKGRKLICGDSDSETSVLLFGAKNYVIQAMYYYGDNNANKEVIDKMISSLSIKEKGIVFSEKRSYENKAPFFKVNLPSDWSLMKLNSSKHILLGQRAKEPEVGFDVYVETLNDDMKKMSKKEYFNAVKSNDVVKEDDEGNGLKSSRYFESTGYKINNELTSEIFYKYRFKDEKDNDKVKAFAAGYRIIDKDKVIVIGFNYFGENEKKFEATLENFRKTVLSKFTLGRKITGADKSSGTSGKAASGKAVVSAANKLKGKILLQVQSKGEAWYVCPKDGKRYYMKNGEEAFKIMRSLGEGITNANLEKMKKSKTLAKKYSGKIFLQVEDKGQAYYVDFNGNLNYLKDGNAAYSVLRSLGLGISNADLDKISASE
ncbi:MAG: S1C family serine protease [Patescibacteria group bacterium]|jgi:V8-like Glu-specific endopeptidase